MVSLSVFICKHVRGTEQSESKRAPGRHPPPVQILSVLYSFQPKIPVWEILDSQLIMEREFFLPPATKLGQGNIFKGVCDSVNRGVLPQCMLGYHPHRPPIPPGADTTPPSRHFPAQIMLGDTVNARVVHILLECNLVAGSLELAYSLIWVPIRFGERVVGTPRTFYDK